MIMALNICNAETEELARIVSELTGETKTQAVKVALKERLNQLQHQQFSEYRIQELLEIAKHCSSLPVLDDQSADEILGYDENGLPS